MVVGNGIRSNSFRQRQADGGIKAVGPPLEEFELTET